jgi:hypothetical protein
MNNETSTITVEVSDYNFGRFAQLLAKRVEPSTGHVEQAFTMVPSS